MSRKAASIPLRCDSRTNWIQRSGVPSFDQEPGRRDALGVIDAPVPGLRAFPSDMSWRSSKTRPAASGSCRSIARSFCSMLGSDSTAMPSSGPAAGSLLDDEQVRRARRGSPRAAGRLPAPADHRPGRKTRRRVIRFPIVLHGREARRGLGLPGCKGECLAVRVEVEVAARGPRFLQGSGSPPLVPARAPTRLPPDPLVRQGGHRHGRCESWEFRAPAVRRARLRRRSIRRRGGVALAIGRRPGRLSGIGRGGRGAVVASGVFVECRLGP